MLSSLCKADIKSGYCKPYYASIKSNRVNSHIGPGKDYRVVCTYIQAGTPVLITAKYDHWRKIKDPAGDECWIHKSLLSPKRHVIIKAKDVVPLTADTRESSKSIAFIKTNVVLELVTVRGNWCKVSVKYLNKKYSGWIKKNTVFGVFDNETS